MNVLKFKSFDDSEDSNYKANNYPQGEDYQTNNTNYLQNYLSKMLNRYIKADFLIGNENLISKEGLLKEVGSDYIVLEMVQSNDLLVCDLYSIKFIQII